MRGKPVSRNDTLATNIRNLIVTHRQYPMTTREITEAITEALPTVTNLEVKRQLTRLANNDIIHYNKQDKRWYIGGY